VIQRDDRREPEGAHVLHVLGQVLGAAPHRPLVLAPEVGHRHAAVQLERAHGGDHHRRRGRQPAGPRLDVHELLGAEVAGEARLGHHDLAELQRQAGGDQAVAAVGDVAERPPVHEGRRALQRLHEVRLDGVLHQHGHGPGRLELARLHQRPGRRLSHDDALDARLEVRQVAGQAQDGHDLGGHGDLEAALARHPVGGAAQAEHDVAQRAVVHVEHALPEDPALIEAERVALAQVVVEHRRQQVVGGADRVHVPGEVQVDVLHRRDLGAAAAGGAALDAEHGPQRGLAQRHDRPPADAAKAVGQPHRRRRLPLAGRRRRHGGHQHQRAVGPVGHAGDGLPADLGLEAAVQLEVVGTEAEAAADLLDGSQLHRTGDLEILDTHVRLSAPARSRSARAAHA
jgi:hypothetical protein